MDLGLDLACAALLLGGLAARGRPLGLRSSARSVEHWPLVLGVLLAGTGFVVGLLAAFRFRHDDYGMLLGSLRGGVGARDLRTIGVDLPFALGVRMGAGHLPFVVMNGAAIVSGALLLAVLLRSVGVAAGTSRLAAALSLLNPGFLVLARWGVGFQWLVAVPVALGTLVALTRARAADRLGDRRRARAWMLVAVACAALALRTKAPAMLVLPAAGAVWMSAVLRATMRAVLLWFVASVAAQAIQLVNCPMPPAEALELGKAAWGRQGQNAVLLWRALRDPLTRLTGAIAITALHSVAVRGLARRARPGAVRADGVEAAGSLRCGPACRLGFASASIAVLFAAPGLSKSDALNDYYVTTAWPWLSTLVAAAWAAVAVPHPSQWVLTGVVALLLLPVGAPHEPRVLGRGHRLADAADDRVEDWARALAEPVRTNPVRPCAVTVRAECPDPADSEASSEALRRFARASDRGDAVRWFARRPDLAVVLGDVSSSPTCAPGLQVRWCNGRVVTEVSASVPGRHAP